MDMQVTRVKKYIDYRTLKRGDKFHVEILVSGKFNQGFAKATSISPFVSLVSNPEEGSFRIREYKDKKKGKEWLFKTAHILDPGSSPPVSKGSKGWCKLYVWEEVEITEDKIEDILM
jgi:hypothetical protein